MTPLITTPVDFWFFTIVLVISVTFAQGALVRLIEVQLRGGRPLNRFQVRFTRISALVTAVCCTIELLQYFVSHLRG